MNEIITIQGLEKSFGRLKVLHGIDLNISKGRIHALLGPNGSGKSTLVKCLLGLVIPDSGSIKIDNRDIKGNWNYRSQIGYMPQIAHFPENMKVHELIQMVRDIRNQRADEAFYISLLNYEDSLNKPLKTLSGGTRQKVNATLAMMFDSEILIFDEATVGLDPVSRLKFKNQIRAEREKGKTIILVSHFSNEVEELADDIIFILEGSIRYQGSVQELKDANRENNLELAIAELLEGNGANNPKTHA